MKNLAILFQPHEAKSCAQFASTLGLPFDFLCIGFSLEHGFGEQLTYQAPFGDTFQIWSAIENIASQYTVIFSATSMAAKDLLAYAAGKLDLPLVTDAIETITPTKFKRPILAGSIIATVQISASKFLSTFRPSLYQNISVSSAKGSTQALVYPAISSIEIVKKAAKTGGRPDLSQAKVVVSGGKPLKDAETFEKLIGGLADKLNGAVGATRAAVDSGIAPNELQVGQTGKIVSPELYIAAGISGSTQHAAGIKDSKVIVAINKDPEAPIFDIADLGLVADLFEAIPELISKIPAR